MIITVKVTPGSKEENLEILVDGTYKAKVRATASDGKANEALIEMISEYFDVAQSLVTIKSGFASRIKRIEISK